MLILLFFFLLISFLSLFVGALMALFSVNEQTLKESGYSNAVAIFHLPELFQKKWYKPNRLYVRKMIIGGFIGCLSGFALLYILNKLGLV
ncbi:hypothetical protein [Pseudoalteromonas tunicata]|jgi:hypothetical protein|uniref:Uncharacterized protein n=1 Tax=Pseudoalteromonas tunicata D2 TaxID=87626 RepID=A4CAH3_9GAMM|nr:hypothetical protein [Pseudoalteromonas tunicata]ATC94926.1 hypothetical protein PTUN_a2448 [Pseudoalteromonas tunicata]AXT30595.1 hypothetical protein D1819_07020 [Pseudoalteromonas tunicata]EAR28381.1 hypothetical protein PTD2_21237 [Pseudoalteromonas tunicata D2]